MGRLELFQEMYNLTTYNLLCYSQSYLMDKPKTNCEKEWNKENEKAKLLEEIIEEEKQKKMGFTRKGILSMYPNVQYYVINSNGGLLAGTVKLVDAKKYAEQYKKEYLNDPLNSHLGVGVYNKEGINIYNAIGNQNKFEDEEAEEFE